MLKAPELGGLVNVFDAVAWEAACSLSPSPPSQERATFFGCRYILQNILWYSSNPDHLRGV